MAAVGANDAAAAVFLGGPPADMAREGAYDAKEPGGGAAAAATVAAAAGEFCLGPAVDKFISLIGADTDDRPSCSCVIIHPKL